MKLYEHFGKTGFHTSIVTSFGIDFDAYENMMLARFRGAGCHNNILLADGGMLLHALDGASALPRHAGRLYTVTGAAAQGVFHPKITLQVGRKAGRLIVGSANVTSAGLAGNLELAGLIECGTEDSGERRLIAAAWHYARRLTEAGDAGVAEQIHWMSVRARWLVETTPADGVVTLADGSRAGFFCSGRDTGIGQQFLNAIGQDKVERILVISPYWDDGLSALNFLMAQTQAAECVVLVDRGRNTFPVEALAADSAVSFADFKAGDPKRFIHAKVVIVQTADTDHVLYGSANCTFAALGSATSSGINEEACFYRALPRDAAITLLGLEDSLQSDRLASDDLLGVDRGEPLPLDELRARNPGRFVCRFDTLVWLPSDVVDPAVDAVELLGPAGEILPDAALRLQGEFGPEVRFRLKSKGARPSFARARFADGRLSAPAVIVVVDVLRGAMRETRSKRIDLAIEQLDDETDVTLLLLETLNDIEAAEAAQRETGPSTRRPRQNETPKAPEPVSRTLNYEAFVAGRHLKSDAPAHGGSTLMGSDMTHIRGFLNRILHLGTSGAEYDTDADDQKLEGAFDLGDEVGDGADALERGGDFGAASLTEAEAEKDRARRKSIQRRANREQLIEAVADLQEQVRDKVRNGDLTNIDMLRLRAMLMVTASAGWDSVGKTANALQVLPTAGDVSGAWPRLLGKCLFAYFGGTNAAIRHLVIDEFHDEIPDDIIECWASSMWSIQAILSACHQHAEYKGLIAPLDRLGVSIYRLVRLQRDEFLGDRLMVTFKALSARFCGQLGLDGDAMTRSHARVVQALGASPT